MDELAQLPRATPLAEIEPGVLLTVTARFNGAIPLTSDAMAQCGVLEDTSDHSPLVIPARTDLQQLVPGTCYRLTNLRLVIGPQDGPLASGPYDGPYLRATRASTVTQISPETEYAPAVETGLYAPHDRQSMLSTYRFAERRSTITVAEPHGSEDGLLLFHGDLDRLRIISEIAPTLAHRDASPDEIAVRGLIDLPRPCTVGEARHWFVSTDPASLLHTVSVSLDALAAVRDRVAETLSQRPSITQFPATCGPYGRKKLIGVTSSGYAEYADSSTVTRYVHPSYTNQFYKCRPQYGPPGEPEPETYRVAEGPQRLYPLTGTSLPSFESLWERRGSSHSRGQDNVSSSRVDIAYVIQQACEGYCYEALERRIQRLIDAYFSRTARQTTLDEYCPTGGVLT